RPRQAQQPARREEARRGGHGPQLAHDDEVARARRRLTPRRQAAVTVWAFGRNTSWAGYRLISGCAVTPTLAMAGPSLFSAKAPNASSLSQASMFWQVSPSNHVRWAIPPSGASSSHPHSARTLSYSSDVKIGRASCRER